MIINVPFVPRPPSRAHRLTIGDRCQDHLGATELEKFCGGVLTLTVDVVVRAEVSRERLLVPSSRDADRSKTHLCSKLNPKVAKSTQPEHSDDIACPSPAISKTIERRDAGAHQWCRLHG
jgi:hypothetical protein